MFLKKLKPLPNSPNNQHRLSLIRHLIKIVPCWIDYR